MVRVTIGAEVSPEKKAELIRRAGAEGKNTNQLLNELVDNYLGEPAPPVNAAVSEEIDNMLNDPGTREHLKHVVGDLLNEITATKQNAIVLERRARTQAEAETAEFELPEISAEELEELVEEPEVDKCPGCGVDVERKADVQKCGSCGETLEWVDEKPAGEGGGWKKAALWLLGGGVALYVLFRLLAAGRRH